MREHMGLFRGKLVDNGEWVEGAYVRTKRHHCIITGYIDDRFIVYGNYAKHVELYIVDPDTAGECTGLTDKNGKLIFEGDIIEQVHLGVKHRFTIVYSQVAFAWGQKNNNGLTGRLEKGIGTLEIIGNIYDNPELLEGAGDDA